MDYANQRSTVRPEAIKHRVAWVDIVKGISIFLVVMMHSTLGVQNATGETSWMGAIVEFARPFRIPCFMLVSGLFLHKTIDGDWRRYLDRKVLHFVYFYCLWVALQVLVKTPAWMGAGQTGLEIAFVYFTTFVQPFGTLWFIYILPVFYVVTRWLRNVDFRIVLAVAIVLQTMPIHTGSTLIDEFASRFVYFYVGYIFYSQFFNWATFCAKRSKQVFILVALWGLANLFATSVIVPEFMSNVMGQVKIADLPIVSLIAAFAGTLMVIAIAAQIMQVKNLQFMRWVGERSIIIYLAFFLPMGVSRFLLLKFGADILSTGSIAAIVTITAATVPLILYGLVKFTGMGEFLFIRPSFARLKPVGNKSNFAGEPAE